MSEYDLNICQCGQQARIEVYHATHFGKVGARVVCMYCGASSGLKGISRMLDVPKGIKTIIDDLTVTKGIKEAIIDWNVRNSGQADGGAP